MAESPINSTSVAQRPDVYIEPGTGPAMVPYRPQSNLDEFGTVGFDDDIENPGEAFGADQTPETDQGLQPPETFTVISQTPRINPDGVTVMDIVVDIGDTLGANSFELRFI